MSRVDVVIPCYNYGHFLRACANSVLSQPIDVRVLVIDDASTDDSATIGDPVFLGPALTVTRERFHAEFVQLLFPALRHVGVDFTGSGNFG